MRRAHRALGDPEHKEWESEERGTPVGCVNVHERTAPESVPSGLEGTAYRETLSEHDPWGSSGVTTEA